MKIKKFKLLLHKTKQKKSEAKLKVKLIKGIFLDLIYMKQGKRKRAKRRRRRKKRCREKETRSEERK